MFSMDGRIADHNTTHTHTHLDTCVMKHSVRSSYASQAPRHFLVLQDPVNP